MYKKWVEGITSNDLKKLGNMEFLRLFFIGDFMSPKAFNKSLFFSYVCCIGNPKADTNLLIKLFLKSKKKFIMFKKEYREAYKSLPRIVKIYRTCPKKGIYRFSWTTDKSAAKQWGTIKRKPYLYQTKIMKMNIFCCHSYEGPNEIIVNPTKFLSKPHKVKLSGKIKSRWEPGFFGGEYHKIDYWD